MFDIVGDRVSVDMEQERALRAVEGVGCVLDRFAAMQPNGVYVHDSAMFEMLGSVLQDAAATLAISMGCATLDAPAPECETMGN